jgi:tetratricopeptide (TPR) repeat protein
VALERWAARPWLLPAILGLGLLLRVLHLFALSRSPFFEALIMDARAYDEWGQRIAAGEWIGRSAFWVDPLYAYVLGLLYRVLGHDLLLPRLLNVAFGLATALLVARIAESVWRSRAAALIAALLFVLFVPGIYFEGHIEKTALSVLLVALGVTLFLRGSLRDVVAAGIVTGLATLARGNSLAFVPIGALALALGWDSERDAEQSRRELRLRRAGAFVLGALPVIALATLHNYRASGELVPTTTNLGVNLYLGNHPGNVHGYYTPPPFLTPATGAEVPDFRAEATRRTGHDPSDAELSAYWTSETWQALKNEPGAAVTRTFSKLWLVFHNQEIADSEHISIVADWSPVLRLPIVWFGQLLPLAVLGAVVGWRSRKVRMLVTVAAVYVVSLLPFFVMARLRVQLVPLMAVLGSGALLWLAASVREHRRRELVGAGVLLTVIAFISLYQPEFIAKQRQTSTAITWNNLGATFLDQRRQEDAIRAYERAVSIDAAGVPAALRTLGELYLQRDDFARAESAMKRVLELRPASNLGRQALVRLYEAMSRDERHRNDESVKARLAEAYRAVGRSADASARSPAELARQARELSGQGRQREAISMLEQAMRTGPYDEGARYLLGELMEKHAPPGEMVAFWSQAVASDPKPQTSHYFWAVGLERQGNLDGALKELAIACEVDPAHEMSENRQGTVLERQGKLADALAHYRRAVDIFPEFRNAHENAARVLALLGRHAEARKHEQLAQSSNPNTPRRFVYWARFLSREGRIDAAIAELERALAANPGDVEARELLAEVRPRATPEASGSAISEAQRARLLEILRKEPRGTPIWLAAFEADARGRALGAALAKAFQDAGWTLRKQNIAFRIKAGIHLFAAEETPPRYVVTAYEALVAAGLKPMVYRGYRAHYERMTRERPGYQGLPMTAEQTYVVAVGPVP